MFSKSIKISTFIITTVLYGFLAYLFFFSYQVPDLTLLLKWLDDTYVISDTTQIVFACFVLFGPGLTQFFAFIMRAIDWHRKRYGGKVWIFGGILAVLIFMGMFFLVNNIHVSPSAVFAIVLSFEYLLCILAIFVPQGQMESDGSSNSSGGGSSSDGYSRWKDSSGFEWSCYGGGCQ